MSLSLLLHSASSKRLDARDVPRPDAPAESRMEGSAYMTLSLSKYELCRMWREMSADYPILTPGMSSAGVAALSYFP